MTPDTPPYPRRPSRPHVVSQNIASGRDFIDTLSVEVADLEAEIASDAEATDLETAREEVRTGAPWFLQGRIVKIRTRGPRFKCGDKCRRVSPRVDPFFSPTAGCPDPAVYMCVARCVPLPAVGAMYVCVCVCNSRVVCLLVCGLPPRSV